MNISLFFNSYVGMYVAQAFCHSFIAALIVDRAIQAWKITNPLVKQRFSLIVIVVPIVSFPVYQLLNPGRGSVSFRLTSLFDVNRWLAVEIWGIIPLNLLFVVMLMITALVFLVQEMIPIVMHTIESRRSSFEEEEETIDHPVIREALSDFPGERPNISVIDDDELLLFSSTGKDATVYMSSGLIEGMDRAQLQAAIAHEVAHIERNKRPLLVAVYLIRILMFFNPVVLVEFRRMVQEEEKICDDAAVALTHSPEALAAILRRFNPEEESPTLNSVKKLSNLSAALEDYSHNVHIEGRIRRLTETAGPAAETQWMPLLFTLAAVAIINYFVV